MSGPFKPSGKYWHYFAGKPFVNRVVAQENRYGTIRIVWVEDGRTRAKHTGSYDRFRAVIEAENKAAELLTKRNARKRRTYRTAGEIMAIRADLEQVARKLNLPKGVAPKAWDYRKHGRYNITRVQSAFVGWKSSKTKKSKRPAESWTSAMKRYGFTPAGYRRNVGTSTLFADLRRVAMLLGKPGELPGANTYDRLGKWSSTCLRNRYPGRTWPEIGDEAGLSASAVRRQKADKQRGRALHPKVETEAEPRRAA
jgi:hypothetical protein